ncbi:MAG: DUF4124 domain-containing protein [Gammaproteobacteria bacterium]|jgi:hypothetical protein|nr:DUF4124 domain-containing protein [Gammaproteobacteria bacterium]
MRWAVAGLALLCGPVLAQGVYKWTDAQGRTHFGDRPPPAGAAAVATPPAPAPDAAAADRRAQQQRLLDAFSEERREQREQADRAQREERARNERCARARDQARGLEAAGQVYVLDGQGRRQYLNDGGRSQALAKAREDVRRWCP